MTRARDVATQGGLVLLTPGSATNGTVGSSGGISFSAVSSMSLNNIFSNTYTNYLIQMTYSGTTENLLNIRFRTSGTDNSNGNYQRHRINLFNNSISITSGLNTSSGEIAAYYTNTVQTVIFEIVNPFQSKNTSWFSKTQQYGDAGMAGYEYRGIFGASTSFDGFTLLPASGTITGDIKVYGYK